MRSKGTIMFAIVIALVIALGIFAGVYGLVNDIKKGDIADVYNPTINPTDFSTNITNKYLNLPRGKRMVFETQTKDGIERGEVLVTQKIMTVMGVPTLVYWDRVWLNDALVEDTRDYVAEDKEGNVWYFGEDVDNYENGTLKDHAGAWLAGVSGAKPGIWMKANPRVGDSYRQEYYPGEAEDMAEVLSVSETVTVRGKEYSNCLKTYDFTPLDPNAKEHKYYCPEVGGVVLVVDLLEGTREELLRE